VTIEAREALVALRGLARGKRGQPARVQPHLARVVRQRQPRQPRAVMRRADGDDMGHALGIGLFRVPAAHGEPAHAVRDDHRRAAGAALERRDALLDEADVFVDRVECRLEVQRHERHARTVQPLAPSVPQAPVAEEPMHEQHADAASRRLRQVIRPAATAKRLAPEKNARGGTRLAPPGGAQQRCAGVWRRIVPPPERQQDEFDAEHQRVQAQHDDRPGHRPHRVSGAPRQRCPQHGQRQQAEREALLQTRQHVRLRTRE